MSCCHGGCGCEKKEGAPKKKDARLKSREVGKLCPVCDAEYLASGPFFKKNSVGLDTTHCVDCGMQEVWAYLPKCWCGMTIRPRDTHCAYHGHQVCRYECGSCPGWHDYSSLFVDKRG